MTRSVCIHGHFYQPPRENPWLEEIELQDSAYPFHDWNERIAVECYAPNAASRILDNDRKILDIVNNYSRISFNFGPTLLSWMEDHHPDTYAAILEADRLSMERFSGHGSALAQAYNHLIMPLANSADKRTQLIWGLRDFEHRFGRKTEGMWLPETAVDLETLEILAEEGIRFTILAPRQAHEVRKIGEKEWTDVSGDAIDPKRSYLCKLPSGSEIALFFYDGPVSQAIAFEGLLKDGQYFADRLTGAFAEDDHDQLVHIATDGETYGHHHRHGDMALAYCLHHIEANELARITVYAEYLDMYPPEYEVRIYENSSWSCVHGVERWRADCGCSTGMNEGWSQEWRKPLREALDTLRDKLAGVYERECGKLSVDPWQARNDYIDVIHDRSGDAVDEFMARHAGSGIGADERVRLLKLLEMQRHAMLMYTSCGWFFDEISGIETTQIMQYASRAMQLARDLADEDFEPAFIETLADAPSNIDSLENGAVVFEQYVKPAKVDLLRVGAHFALSSLFEDYKESAELFCFSVSDVDHEEYESGFRKLGIGRARLFSAITRESTVISYAAVHLGDHNLFGGVKGQLDDDAFASMKGEFMDMFDRSDIPGIVRLIDSHFGGRSCSLWYLFRDEQRKVFDRILEENSDAIDDSYRRIYEKMYPVIQAMNELHVPVPKALTTPVEYILTRDIIELLEQEDMDIDEFGEMVERIENLGVIPDWDALNLAAGQRIVTLLGLLAENSDDLALLERIEHMVELLGSLSIDLHLWEAQNSYFSLVKSALPAMQERADGGDDAAGRWIDRLQELGRKLNISGVNSDRSDSDI